MSRLDSLAGASFRPTQQTQTASSAAEKAVAKLLDGGKHQGHFHTDGFDRRPRQPQRDPGFYTCNAVYPDPNKPKNDPGFYTCNAVYPNPDRPHCEPKPLPKWEPLPLPRPKPMPLPKWDPAPRTPGLPPGIAELIKDLK